MNIIQDQNFTYQAALQEALKAHNHQFVGGRLQEEKHWYMLEKEDLLAAAKVTISWDWASLNDIYYKEAEDLHLLCQKILRGYGQTIVGIKTYVRDPKKSQDLQEQGFIKKGQTYKSPKGQAYDYLVLFPQAFSFPASQQALALTELREDLEAKKEGQSMEMEEVKSSPVMYVALKEDTFLGGVYGEVDQDSLYIKWLAVLPAYQKTGLGEGLMLQIEAYARARKLDSITLGTTDFHAKDFYRKLGYEVTLTKENDPRGYNSYSMVKVL